jgi:hypothetical protein
VGWKNNCFKISKARTGAPTAAQSEAQEKFQVASRYAKAVMANTDQSLAEGYQTALKPRQNLYARALEDFLTPPVVNMIETHNYHGVVGDTVMARATDDFRVTQVIVEIFAPDGSLLERGNAVLTFNGLDWKYTSTQANPVLAGTRIRATATDVPGNDSSLELIL